MRLREDECVCRVIRKILNPKRSIQIKPPPSDPTAQNLTKSSIPFPSLMKSHLFLQSLNIRLLINTQLHILYYTNYSLPTLCHFLTFFLFCERRFHVVVEIKECKNKHIRVEKFSI